jgi:hypothetical protein
MIIRIWSFNFILNLNFNVKNTQTIFFDLFIKRNKFNLYFLLSSGSISLLNDLLIVLFYEKLCKTI